MSKEDPFARAMAALDGEETSPGTVWETLSFDEKTRLAAQHLAQLPETEALALLMSEGKRTYTVEAAEFSDGWLESRPVCPMCRAYLGHGKQDFGRGRQLFMHRGAVVDNYDYRVEDDDPVVLTVSGSERTQATPVGPCVVTCWSCNAEYSLDLNITQDTSISTW